MHPTYDCDCRSEDEHQAVLLAERRAAYETPVDATTIRFVATCEPCGWIGRERHGNLGALADFDRHQATAGHRDRWLRDLTVPDPEEAAPMG